MSTACIATLFHNGPFQSWSLDSLRRPALLFRRWREKTRHRRDLAALDPRVLADIGLRRSLVHPACLLTAGDE